MVMISFINWWAVLVAALANMALGFYWYSPAGFGTTWQKLIGITEKQIKDAKKKGMCMTMTRNILVMFISASIMAFITANFAKYTGATDLISGLQLGFHIWLGYIATVMIGTVIWEGKPFKLYAINAGYWLVSLLVMASIVVVWQ